MVVNQSFRSQQVSCLREGFALPLEKQPCCCRLVTWLVLLKREISPHLRHKRYQVQKLDVYGRVYHNIETVSKREPTENDLSLCATAARANNEDDKKHSDGIMSLRARTTNETTHVYCV